MVSPPGTGAGLMHAFVQLWHWLTTASHWSGPCEPLNCPIPTRVLQHVELSLLGVAIAMAVALPVGMLIGHTRRGEFLAVSIANLGRAIPSFAILSLVFLIMLQVKPKLSFGFVPTVIALFLLAIPPILTNTYVGIQGVDPDTVEAARGVGMTEREVLVRLELPLAAPLIIAGLRTAAVQVVATATLAAVIGGGGLGRYIVDGFAVNDDTMVLAGAVLVAALAILTELAFAGFERIATPRFSQRGRRRPEVEPEPAAAFKSA
ncbi:MAG: ABC transporter permease [Actinomycetota bacterium]|nr:ABC transporter permease [Actinomycetota bacterium]